MRVLFALVLCVQTYLALSDDCTPSPCSSGETCCPGPYPGVVGCCPSPNAVCCSDGQHCCPQNKVCDLSKGTCDSKVSQIPFVFQRREQPKLKLQAVAVKEAQRVAMMVCPHEMGFCPDNNTCCLLASYQMGCCPYPSAICCNDGIHCCPNGTRCDDSSQHCLQAATLMEVAPKRPKMPAFPLFK